MGSTHKGLDGVDTYPANDRDIDSYRRAEEMVAQMRIPQFLRGRDPHDLRLGVIAAGVLREHGTPLKSLHDAQEVPMKRLPVLIATLVFASLALAGCHAAMSTNDTPSTKPGQSNAINHWPLVFNGHWFGASCYSTYGCRVEYADFTHRDDPDDQLRRSSASVGQGYPANLRGGWGPIPNFPPPAVVDWRSADGTRLHAEIDFNEIFPDRLVRHNVPQEEAGPTYNPQPEIILEVNDRTINVYMKSHVSTKELQNPDNPYSRSRTDLIKVFSRTY